MGGGILQLIYIGEQNLYLTENPQVTFFKMMYRRHTNFSIDTRQENFTTAISFGQRSQCVLSKDGDLLYRLGIHIKLSSLNTQFQNKSNSNSCNSDKNCLCMCPNCLLDKDDKLIYGWANAIGHVLLEYIEFRIGGCIIDRQYGEWMEIWTELSQTAEKRLGYYEMIGKKDPLSYTVDSFTGAMDLFIPFTFWFCRNVGASIPCVALKYHDIEVIVKFRDFDNCWVTNKENAVKPKATIDAQLYADYIYLGLDERHKFAHETHVYLIEQVQLSENNAYNTNTGTAKILLEFNHPIKSLYWIVQRDDVTGPPDGVLKDDPSYPKGNDWFNFTSSKNPRSEHLIETFTEAMLQFNGDDRFQYYFPAFYFRKYHPYHYHTRVPTANYIYNYNFGWQPEELPPTGTCNFSRIKDSQFVLRLGQRDYNNNHTGHIGKKNKHGVNIRMYGLGYNFLVISAGLGAVMFSN
jgi:hypothetical protein